ncbi:hypothetical protein LJK88_10860 [Paenibacillus sp. P26]|nr:hypothetical protein LJK88_10860 [Paenibacillus sp. P26]
MRPVQASAAAPQGRRGSADPRKPGRERERDRKNKGAPRWLKEKQNGAGKPKA